MIKPVVPHSGLTLSCSISRAWCIRAPYADKIIGYQYIGLMNPEDSGSFAGHESSAELYRQYAEYLKK